MEPSSPRPSPPRPSPPRSLPSGPAPPYPSPPRPSPPRPSQPVPPPSRGGFGSTGADFMYSSLQQMPQHLEDMYLQMQPEYGSQDHTLSESYRLDDLMATDNQGNRILRMQFDMRNFQPQDIHVTTENHQVLVNAVHMSEHDGKTVTDEYQRGYTLPPYINSDTVTSELTETGVLCVSAQGPGSMAPVARGGCAMKDITGCQVAGGRAPLARAMGSRDQVAQLPVRHG